MSIKLTGTFSFNMLVNPALTTLRVTELPIVAVKSMTLTSHIGHESTALLVSKALNQPIARNRTPIYLAKGDSIIHVMTFNKTDQRLDNIDNATVAVYSLDYTLKFYLVEVL